MKSEWRVNAVYVGTKKLYQVYRLLDAEGKDEDQNKEYVQGSLADNRKDAQKVADELNRWDAEHYWRGCQ